MKKLLVIILLSLFIASSAMASASLSNRDFKQYKILAASTQFCFSGIHTFISSNTTISVPAGWVCLKEKKPAVRLESGKYYIIKNGRIKERYK
ncbi:MAG: hypothetical protein CSA18_04455 [Deltaproteobacteria bacterium]|nr:MAG: hypothetical protein CSA18_04455 [Deltaproteobacteria bacterium]